MQGKSKRSARLGASGVKAQFVTDVICSAKEHGQVQRIRQSSPVTGLEWPIGFQEVKVPRFHDNGARWW
jgi:hypothetical protein